MGSTDPIAKPVVILFDGICNLCNAAVNIIIRKDKHSVFVFAALQSDYAKHRLVNINLSNTQLTSIILLKDDDVFLRSDAILEIARLLPWPWPLFFVFKIIPRFIRDGLYNLIAKYRYKLFGATDHCMIPTKAILSRFLS